MSTYYDKKKLIEDSSDVYISDYDKNLDYSYLSDIIDQKRAYAKAESVGDTAGMKKANDRANSVRMQAASYTAGADGSKYNRAKRPYEEQVPQRKNSKYSGETDRLYKLISSYDDFSYDVYSDPLYQTYKDIYLSLGDDAYERALGENSMRTGGVSNSSAISAATAAKNKYNTMLANVVPELYEKAYSRHRDGLEDLYNRLELAQGFDETDYKRYRDSVDDYREDRDYYYRKDEDISDDLYTNYIDETELAYDISRDEVADKQKEDEFNFSKDKFYAELENKDNESRRDDELKKYSIVVNLAKALYGKVPVPKNVVTGIMEMLK